VAWVGAGEIGGRRGRVRGRREGEGANECSRCSGLFPLSSISY